MAGREEWAEQTLPEVQVRLQEPAARVLLQPLVALPDDDGGYQLLPNE